MYFSFKVQLNRWLLNFFHPNVVISKWEIEGLLEVLFLHLCKKKTSLFVLSNGFIKCFQFCFIFYLFIFFAEFYEKERKKSNLKFKNKVTSNIGIHSFVRVITPWTPWITHWTPLIVKYLIVTMKRNNESNETWQRMRRRTTLTTWQK